MSEEQFPALGDKSLEALKKRKRNGPEYGGRSDLLVLREGD